jgi:hypothetical protein
MLTPHDVPIALWPAEPREPWRAEPMDEPRWEVWLSWAPWFAGVGVAAIVALAYAVIWLATRHG